VPGASLLGDPLSFGIDIAAAYIAPRQDSAIVVGADQSLHLFLLNGGAPTEVSLGGVTGTPERVVFSPSGTAVALISSGSARVLTGLPGAPTLTGSVKVEGNATAGRGPRSRSISAPSLALSDDGTYVLTIAQGTAIAQRARSESHAGAGPGQCPGGIRPGGHDAAVVDSLTGLTLIRDASGAAGAQLLAAPDEGLAGPVGVAFSQDKQTLYVASATAQSVAAFNLAGASRTAIGCACTPTTLAPMGNLFRLTELTTGPLWVLDGTAATPRTVFVPARVE
jgi:DNA-binding beta-propeller fold protein YncE